MKKKHYITNLDEDFEISDVKEGDLRKVIQEMTESTVVETIHPSQFLIYSLMKQRNIAKNELTIAIINPDRCDMKTLMPRTPAECYFQKRNGTYGTLPISDLLKMGVSEKQVLEVEKAGFFLQLRKLNSTITMIPSKALFATLCRRLGIGTMTEGRNTLRDIYLGSLMRDAKECTLVYRKSLTGSHAKAFACFSEKYQYTPQSIIFDFMDKLSTMENLEGGHLSVRSWKVNHFITTIDFALNELCENVNGMKITPGVRMTLSDVGDAAFSLQSILIVNGGVVLLNDTVVRKHNAVLQVDDMVSDYEQSAFPNLVKTMETLKSYAQTSVQNKRESILSLLDKIRFHSAFGVKYSASYIESYIKDMDETPCTALDVVMEVLKIPGNIQIHCCSSAVERVSNAIGTLFSVNVKGAMK